MSISDDRHFDFELLLIRYFSVICKFLFANHNNCAIIIKHGRNMLSWSSGQDVALSRRNQGFDSPREYQKPWNYNVPRLLTFLRYSIYHYFITSVCNGTITFPADPVYHHTASPASRLTAACFLIALYASMLNAPCCW